MRRAEKAAEIQRVLNELFPAPPIPLRHRDPYTLLVAVVLSAQTTDKKVNEVTPALFERAPNPDALRRLTIAQIHDMIRTVGLAPQKAKALRGLGERLCEVYAGEVPRTFEDLESLPGVGHKTASVVMAQAFGIPAFPVDTHIHRLAQRWGLSDGKNVKRTEADLKSTFAEEHWIELHKQIIYFGREYCPAQRHDMAACPICSFAASKERIRAEKARQAKPKAKATGKTKAKVGKKTKATPRAKAKVPKKTKATAKVKRKR